MHHAELFIEDKNRGRLDGHAAFQKFHQPVLGINLAAGFTVEPVEQDYVQAGGGVARKVGDNILRKLFQSALRHSAATLELEEADSLRAAVFEHPKILLAEIGARR